MVPYWLLFVLWAAGTIQFSRLRERPLSTPFFWLASLTTAAMVGLRFQVGGDWTAYMYMYDQIGFQDLWTSFTITDPGYAAVNWLSSLLDLGIWPVNLACALLFMAGLGKLALRQPNPWLAILVAVPYLIIVVAMGYTRQAAAIGIVCFALADATERRLVRIVVIVGIAALFHKTAVLILPMLLLPIARRNLLFGIVGGILFLLLFLAVLSRSSDTLIQNYAQGSYDSQGAGIRVAMNVAAALVFLAFRSRFTFDPFIRSYWTVNAILALVSIVALASVSASSGVDRISLFLIPLQVVVFSRLPYEFSATPRPVPSLLLSVIGYSFLVQFVWLNYADNAGSWVPYSTTVAPDDSDRNR